MDCVKNIYPKISVVIATYNRVTQLKQSINSITRQNYANYEIVIINDGSTDGTSEYLNNIAKRNNFLVIENVENLGLQKSLNKAIEVCNGEFVARIDDDDLWIDENKLSDQIRFFQENPDHGLIGTNYKNDDTIYKNPETDEDIRRQILFRCPFRHSTVMFKMKLWELCGRYDERLKYSEDWDLWLKMGTKTKMHNLQVTTCWISEKNNLTSKYFKAQIPINYNIVKSYKSKYPKSILAIIYHKSVSLFFRVIPLDSKLHNFFKRIFLFVFRMG